jgi:hypothetical protein
MRGTRVCEDQYLIEIYGDVIEHAFTYMEPGDYVAVSRESTGQAQGVCSILPSPSSLSSPASFVAVAAL